MDGVDKYTALADWKVRLRDGVELSRRVGSLPRGAVARVEMEFRTLAVKVHRIVVT